MARIKRDGKESVKAAKGAYPYKCCAVCGLTQDALDVAHLDNDPTNNDPDNLAFLCKTHHWMSWWLNLNMRIIIAKQPK